MVYIVWRVKVGRFKVLPNFEKKLASTNWFSNKIFSFRMHREIWTIRISKQPENKLIFHEIVFNKLKKIQQTFLQQIKLISLASSWSVFQLHKAIDISCKLNNVLDILWHFCCKSNEKFFLILKYWIKLPPIKFSACPENPDNTNHFNFSDFFRSSAHQHIDIVSWMISKLNSFIERIQYICSQILNKC